MRTFAVAKAQGTGNDFILLENIAGDRLPYSALARKWCRRRYDLGADGLLVIESPSVSGADYAMRVFNADGSEAEMCGNGIRCIACYMALERPSLPAMLTAQTKAGMVTTRLLSRGSSSTVAVDMGAPRFLRREIPMRGDPSARALDIDVETPIGSRRISAVSMGNPHCVTFVDATPELIDVEAHVKALEQLELFPHGANYEIVQVEHEALAVSVFERGAGETRACGTGACAAAAAAIVTGRAHSPLHVRMNGGALAIEWASPDANIIMTGPAEIVCRAELSLSDEKFALMLASENL